MNLPRLFLLNIGGEAALSHREKNYTPPQLVRQMRRDLAPLAAWLSDEPERDAVWVAEGVPLPSSMDSIPLPRLVTARELAEESFPQPFRLELWGPEPSLVQTLRRKYPSLAMEKVVFPDETALPDHLFDRSAPCLFLKDWDFAAPQWVHSAEELRAYAAFVPHRQLVLKRPFSSSGRGIRLFRIGETDETRLPFPLVVEPFYEKVSDWAAEYTIDADGEVRFDALSHFVVHGFRYGGNWLYPQEVMREKLLGAVGREAWARAQEAHKRFLSSGVAPYYKGPVGIDMMVVREGNSLRLHPFVEMNVRHTMGSLAHRIQRLGGKAFENGLLCIDAVRAGEPLSAEKRYPLTARDEQTRFVATIRSAASE